VRKRAHGGAWAPERLVSDPSQSSKKPHIVHDGATAWVAYEHVSGSGTGIAVGKVIDGPDPILPVTIATTSFAGAAEVRVHTASGRVWVTWVDSGTEVGWSAYDAEGSTWSAPETESYAQDSVSAARGRIESHVLSN
jgi:hypothetical protein